VSDFSRKLVIRIPGRIQHEFQKHEILKQNFPHGDKGVLNICEIAVSKISQNTPSHLNFCCFLYKNPQGSNDSWVKKSCDHQNIIILVCAQNGFSPFSPLMVFRAKSRPQKPSLYGGKGGQIMLQLVPPKPSFITPKSSTCGSYFPNADVLVQKCCVESYSECLLKQLLETRISN
jgi:hypothetical protein